MKSKDNADSKTYREWYARVFREWGTCGGSILLEATFDCKKREITYCVCEEISRDTEIRYALSINGLIFWWVDTMVALGSGEKQGAGPLKEDLWRHALQAVSFLGLFCASLITLPIANYPLRSDTQLPQTPSVMCFAQTHGTSNCIDIHENNVFVYSSFVYSRNSATAQSNWFRRLPLSPLPVNEGVLWVPLGYVSGIGVMH